MEMVRADTERDAVRLRLPADPASALTARRAATKACASAGLPDDLCYWAVLLTSETVTNAVVHGRSEVRLAIDIGERRIRIEVGDDNSRRPIRRHPDAGSLDGRGIALLDAFASDWGVDDVAGGKIVWFEMQV
jgi:anti-sigma regulatory factor (Ser/Thr protein kinase)